MLLRRQLTFLVILGAAFAWGYFGDSFHSASPATIVSERNDLPKTQPTDTPKNGAAKDVPLPLAATGTVHPSGPPPRPPGAEVPARQLTPPTGSLANTLDSIQPGKAQDTQIEQRNAYFDRLSQQLRELNTAGNGAIAPIPGSGTPAENPYAVPGAAVQIQAEPIAPPGLDADEEPDNLEEEEALDSVDPESEVDDAEIGTDE